MDNRLVKILLYMVGAVVFMGIGAFGFSYYQTQLEVTPSPMVTATNTDLNQAKIALFDYFKLLHDGNYVEAVTYHGSGYEYLKDWNPNVDKNDYAQLLENGCRANGLQCLEILGVVQEKTLSASEFIFKIQFKNADGTLFKSGPCCGATEEEMPTIDTFDFKVRKRGNDFVVVTQPVYRP